MHPPFVYKRESALVRTQALLDTQKAFLSLLKQYNTQVDVGYYAPVARTTLNPYVFPVFIHPLIKRS
jgi:hypothetical protein